MEILALVFYMAAGILFILSAALLGSNHDSGKAFGLVYLLAAILLGLVGWALATETNTPKTKVGKSELIS